MVDQNPNHLSLRSPLHEVDSEAVSVEVTEVASAAATEVVSGVAIEVVFEEGAAVDSGEGEAADLAGAAAASAAVGMTSVVVGVGEVGSVEASGKAVVFYFAVF